MSKPTQKNKLSKKRAKPHKQKTTTPTSQKSKKKIIFLVIVAALTAIPFSMGKYFEFNTPGPYDSGAYVLSAKHILDGAEIGVDEMPSSRLGTLLVNILGVWLFGFKETGPELIQTIFQVAALLLMFIVLSKLFGKLPAAVAVIIASVYISAPLIAKFGNVKEQYMIAFMVLAVSCFILHQLGKGWWYALLAGAFASWAPLFKETGTSVIGALALFVVLQPLLKNKTWRQTAVVILLLFAGAALALVPLYIWIIGWDVQLPPPYKFAWKIIIQKIPTKAVTDAPKAAGYVAGSRKFMPFAEQCSRIFRYYSLLILPIALAMGSILARITRLVLGWLGRTQDTAKKSYDRFVLLFALWWLLDMAFVWISPRSYEQYFLPLNASAAMLGGYIIALYCDKFKKSIYKTRWTLIGIAGFVCMVIMSWHIFFGIEKSPHSGSKYKNPDIRRGYAQKINEISKRRRENLVGAWEVVGEYIRLHSEQDDRIYVWGWYPGIYVKAQRLSSVPKAYEGNMHIIPPDALSRIVNKILTAFEKKPPKFIVDTQKMHFPWDRPPLGLWPRTRKGFLPVNKQVIKQFDADYSKFLSDKIGEDEAQRYNKMKPLRDYVMQNYNVVRINFGDHILFERK
ncbi:MAG: ArnT family glycosyltransferase [Planctomycetota bacterium]|jgi:hypothetical protein